jgi:F-type H+-transporting ATPase subunit delta
MKDSLAARRYAKALIGLAKEKNVIEDIFNDMSLIKNTVLSNKDLQLLLKSPVVNTDKKQDILSAIFKGNLNELSSLFLQLISSKKRESLIQQIANSFIEQYKVLNNIVTAEVTTAIELDKNKINNIVSLYKQEKGNSFEIIEKVNPEIIGGFILRVGDRQIDTSISKEIRELKKAFNKNPYILEY